MAEGETVKAKPKLPHPQENDVPKFMSFNGIIRAKAPIKPPDKGVWNQFAQEVLIIVHTVNSNEYWAAIDHMEPPEAAERCVKYERNFILGVFGGYKAAIVKTKMGGECRDEIDTALNLFPIAQAVVAVGVAYASSTKYKYADVLVSSRIEDMVNVKFTGIQRINKRGPKINIKPNMVRTFLGKKEVWAIQTGFERTESDSEYKVPDVIVGEIISAPWLVDNSEIKDALLETTREAIGGEMEGGILLQLQSTFSEKYKRDIGVIIIKGVADYADGSKGKEWQLTAAMAAVGFAKFQLEQNGDFKPPPISGTPVQPIQQPASTVDQRLRGTGTSLHKAGGKVLTEVDDLPLLMTLLSNSGIDTYQLAIQLRLGPVVEQLKAESLREAKWTTAFLRLVLQSWMASKTRPPLLNDLVTAIFKPPIGNEVLAEKVEKAFTHKI